MYSKKYPAEIRSNFAVYFAGFCVANAQFTSEFYFLHKLHAESLHAEDSHAEIDFLHFIHILWAVVRKLFTLSNKFVDHLSLLLVLKWLIC